MSLFRSLLIRPKRTQSPSVAFESFLKQLETQWLEHSNQTLQDWITQANQSVAESLSQTLSSISSQFPGAGSAPLIDATTAASGSSQSPFLGFGNALGRVVASVINEALKSKETTVRSEESTRSIQSNADFRRSQSQQQAQAAQAVASGQRNL